MNDEQCEDVDIVSCAAFGGLSYRNAQEWLESDELADLKSEAERSLLRKLGKLRAALDDVSSDLNEKIYYKE